MKRVAVLIVSGFLGSGKTTLVKRVLESAQARGLKVGVVSNEFGELGIDAALIGAGEQRYVELAGGCICCELTDELVETLELIRARVDPDWIVIETSGVALPFETQLNLYRPEVRDWVGDEAVVVVVDSEGFLAGPADPGTFENQVSGADLLVLHKVDLVSREQVEEARAGLLKINPDAPVLEASFGNIPLEALFPEGPRPDPHHDHDHHHEHAPHSRFHSFELFFTPGQSEEVIRETVLGQKAVRAKGFVESSTGVRVVQGVGRRVELSPVDQPVGKDLLGRVVVIKLEA